MLIIKENLHYVQSVCVLVLVFHLPDSLLKIAVLKKKQENSIYSKNSK